MKLNEITIPDDIDQYLLKNGFKELDYGSFANIYVSPKHNYVLKIFLSSDKPYIHFLRTKPDSEYFPKIKGKLIKLNEKYHAVRLEKLSEFSSSMPSYYKKDEFIEYCDIVITSFDNKMTLEKCLYNNYGYRDYNKIDAMKEKIINILSDYPGLVRALKYISSLPYDFDMNTGNLMFRGFTPVFIDPVFVRKYYSKANNV